MDIPYRSLGDYIPVDIERLRPAGSYQALLAQRTHAIDDLVARHGRVPPDLLIDRACPTCGGHVSNEELRKDHMTIVRCADCDLVYVNPAFDEEHYQAVYRSTAYQVIMKELGIKSHEYRVERFGAERVDIMERFVSGTDGGAISYLDVGCSTGFVVEAAARRGWETIGIDLNPSATAFGRTRGLDLRDVAIEHVEFPDGHFDALSLFDVLEHLLHPAAMLERAVRLLKPDGIVFLYVPNYDSASRLLLGERAHFIWPTHHLNYYTPSTLGHLLDRCGLDVVFLATEGLDVADYVWYQREVEGSDVSALERIADRLQFLINAGCYGKNLRMIGRKRSGATA